MARNTSTPAFAFGGAPRVNLMPRIEIERRERSVLIRRWGWGLAGALMAVALVGAGTFVLQAGAQLRLIAEQARTTELLTQVAALQPVREKLDLETELVDFRQRAMGTDIAWQSLLGTIEGALPSNISIAEFSLMPGGLPQGEDPALEIGVDGTLVLFGAGPADIVTVVRDIRALPGVLEVDGWGQEEVSGIYRYDLRLALDQSVYTGAYAEEAAE